MAAIWAGESSLVLNRSRRHGWAAPGLWLYEMWMRSLGASRSIAVAPGCTVCHALSSSTSCWVCAVAGAAVVLGPPG